MKIQPFLIVCWQFSEETEELNLSILHNLYGAYQHSHSIRNPRQPLNSKITYLMYLHSVLFNLYKYSFSFSFSSGLFFISQNWQIKEMLWIFFIRFIMVLQVFVSHVFLTRDKHAGFWLLQSYRYFLLFFNCLQFLKKVQQTSAPSLKQYFWYSAIEVLTIRCTKIFMFF